jgi:hypothetical protein
LPVVPQIVFLDQNDQNLKKLKLDKILIVSKHSKNFKRSFLIKSDFYLNKTPDKIPSSVRRSISLTDRHQNFYCKKEVEKTYHLSSKVYKYINVYINQIFEKANVIERKRKEVK